MTDQVKDYIRIIQTATWLCLFTNYRTTPIKVYDKLQKFSQGDFPFSINQIKEVLDFYASIGGCSVYKDGVNTFYNLIHDMDDNKKILMKDGLSFFYAKDKETANECYEHLKSMKIELLTPVH